LVQIPTEKVLLLWIGGGETSISFRQIQQQDLSFECGQNRFQEGLRRGEFSSLLFAVQSYQGRFFYSIGNGRDWENIYIKEVEQCKTTLSSILEEQVSDKYFLSDKQTIKLKESIMNHDNKSQSLMMSEELTKENLETG